MSPNEAARAAYQSSSHLLDLLENRTDVRAKLNKATTGASRPFNQPQ
jgi:hypothetical protein